MEIDIEKIAELAMLDIDSMDKDRIQKDMDGIAKMADILSEIKENISDNKELRTVLREDVCCKGEIFRSENADRQGYIVVPAVIGGEN